MRSSVCLDVFGERKKSVAPNGSRTPDRPSRNLVTVPTILSGSNKEHFQIRICRNDTR